MPEISVIVPVYNVELYLNNCINSILSQTFKDFELILVDDGSTDNSGEICDEYKHNDNRIKVIHKSNGGLSSARNAGLKVSNGKYISFVDSDDYIHPQMYEILHKSIEKNSADISFCSYKKVNYYDIELLKIKYLENIKEKVLISSNNCLKYLSDDKFIIKLTVAWNKLYKRHIFESLYYEEGRIREDEFIVHKILDRCKKMMFIDCQLYFYLQRPNSIMKQGFNSNSVDIIYAYSDRLNFLKYKDEKLLLQQTSNMYTNELIKTYYRVKKELNENKKILKALKLDFIRNIMTNMKYSNCNYKEKIMWILFIFNSKTLKKYF